MRMTGLRFSSLFVLGALSIIACGGDDGGDDSGNPAPSAGGSAGTSGGAGAAGAAGAAAGQGGAGGGSAGQGGAGAPGGSSTGGTAGKGGDAGAAGEAGEGGAAGDAGAAGAAGDAGAAGAAGEAGASGAIADIGFRAAKDGFKFENFGNSAVKSNLTPAELRRMFGDKVCASTAGGGCILTPAAQQWMDENNKGMDGGHCEGMAALSLVFYAKKENASDFGAPATHDLELTDNEKLQRELAYFWSTQAAPPTANAEFGKSNTPKEVVDKLIAAMQAGVDTETFTLGIYKPGYKDGHAITPYAVVDQGGGVWWVMVYDNNFPNDERHIALDTNTNKWTYSASTSPDVPESTYEGDAETKTLTITSTSQRLGLHECSFCADPTPAPGVPGPPGPPAPAFNEVWLTGDADLLLVDDKGNKLGYEAGNFVNTIPGSAFVTRKSGDLWKDDPEPVYRVPTSTPFSITLDGTMLSAGAASDVSLIGPGYTLAVEGVVVDPMQKDTISFSSNGTEISYETSSSETPDVLIGIETAKEDWLFSVKSAGDTAGIKVTLKVDTATGKLSIQVKGSMAYDLVISRIDDQGEQLFAHMGNGVADVDTAYVDFGAWGGNGTPMKLEIDQGSDGTIDQTVDLVDQN